MSPEKTIFVPVRSRTSLIEHGKGGIIEGQHQFGFRAADLLLDLLDRLLNIFAGCRALIEKVTLAAQAGESTCFRASIAASNCGRPQASFWSQLLTSRISAARAGKAAKKHKPTNANDPASQSP
ncbi:MAG: hypothetical protein IPF44_07940 [Betaproteobacteria bacterium]|nr:hypothetical protein [Betaproteobacteria bacterium]